MVLVRVNGCRGCGSTVPRYRRLHAPAMKAPWRRGVSRCRWRCSKMRVFGSLWRAVSAHRVEHRAEKSQAYRVNYLSSGYVRYYQARKTKNIQSAMYYMPDSGDAPYGVMIDGVTLNLPYNAFVSFVRSLSDNRARVSGKCAVFVLHEKNADATPFSLCDFAHTTRQIFKTSLLKSSSLRIYVIRSSGIAAAKSMRRALNVHADGCQRNMTSTAPDDRLRDRRCASRLDALGPMVPALH